MDWNTIVVLSTVGTFCASVGIFAYVDRLERTSLASDRGSVESPASAPAGTAIAMDSINPETPDSLEAEDMDFGNASELANDARLGFPPGWTKMFGTWASPSDSFAYAMEHRSRYWL